MGDGRTEQRRAFVAEKTANVARGPAALAGLAAGAAALGTVEFIAGLFEGVPSLLLAIGDTVVDLMPGSGVRAAIDVFGTSDKAALLIGTVVLAAIFGALLGLVARRRFVPAAAGFVGFAALGIAAAFTQTQTSVVGAVVAAVLGATVGVAVLGLLLGVAARPVEPGAAETGPDRRFLIWSGGAFVVGMVAGVGGWVLSGRERVEQIRRAVRLPGLPEPPAPVPAGSELDIPGISPLFTANDDFYRIDTALRPPVVDPDDWQLEVRGAVDRPFSLTYVELVELSRSEADITLACVSNEVGGDLVGNAKWQGVALRDLLQRAGVQEGGEQLMGYSVDGFTAGFPTSMALADSRAMVAVAMNGEPLPIDHGFPARIVVPGLYGYVSATKWLTAIELTGWDADGYWIPRGWSKEGPVKTQARIDVPRTGRTVASGRTPIAGVAWAPGRGIEQVEVRIDDGPWQVAELADALGEDTWRQWHLPWDATPGEHSITARATDGTGTTQTSERTRPAPDGASGYPSIRVEVD